MTDRAEHKNLPQSIGSFGFSTLIAGKMYAFNATRNEKISGYVKVLSSTTVELDLPHLR